MALSTHQSRPTHYSTHLDKALIEKMLLNVRDGKNNVVKYTGQAERIMDIDTRLGKDHDEKESRTSKVIAIKHHTRTVHKTF